MSILTVTDFKGRYSLSPFPSNADRVNEAIELVEEIVLYSLLGQELKTEFLAGLAVTTPAAKWTELRDGKTYEIGGVQYQYFGIKEMLIRFTFAEIIDKDYFDSSQGVVNRNAAAGNNISQVRRLGLKRSAYNDGVMYYQDAQYYISLNTATYENWVTEAKEYKNA